MTSILIGVIIGPLFEHYLVRALRIRQGDLMILFSSPLGNLLWLVLILTLLLFWRNRCLALRVTKA